MNFNRGGFDSESKNKQRSFQSLNFCNEEKFEVLKKIQKSFNAKKKC